MAPSAMPIEQTATSSKNLTFVEDVRADVDEALGKWSSRLREVIRHIFTNPELAFEEFIAHDTICDFFEEQGFSVTRKAFGVETAFEVLSGEGGRLVSINAEYDALPEVGHACGHNLIAAAGLSAFLAMHFTLKKRGIKGRVQLLGTPAEENGGGKVSLINGGAYKGVDVALMSHPVPSSMMGDGAESDFTGLGATNFLANERWIIEYFGKPTHASACPWDGINAYDAAIAAHVNIGLLRQQIRPNERVHGCMLEGPKVANVIGQYTKLTYTARSDTKKAATALGKRVLNCFHAAALATGCEVKITPGVGYWDAVNNKVLCDRYAQIGNATTGQKVRSMDPSEGLGSTDFGNVTYHVPGLHSMFTIDAPPGTGCHQHGFAHAAGTEDAYARALKTGSLLALTGLDLLVDTKLFNAVRGEWEANMTARGETF